MSSFLENLGLGVGTAVGGCFAQQPPYRGELQNQQAMFYTRMAQYQPPLVKCLHDNCPICKKEAEKHQERLEMAKVEQDKKEKDYKKRCKDYMKKFRQVRANAEIGKGEK